MAFGESRHTRSSCGPGRSASRPSSRCSGTAARGRGARIVGRNAGTAVSAVRSTGVVAHLISAIGVKPNEILAITFTNKAAGEMRERLMNMLGPMARAIWILTFHSACGRILRSEAERLGYRSNFTIYDSADQVRLVKQCLEELEKDPEALRPARRPRADLEREEPARHARDVRASASPPSTTRRSPRCTSSTSAGSPPRTRSTSTTC